MASQVGTASATARFRIRALPHGIVRLERPPASVVYRLSSWANGRLSQGSLKRLNRVREGLTNTPTWVPRGFNLVGVTADEVRTFLAEPPPP